MKNFAKSLKKYLVLVWLLVPVALLSYHFGPGQQALAWQEAHAYRNAALEAEQQGHWEQAIDAYGKAMRMVRDLLTQTDVRLDILDIGGGFPSIYPGLTPPPFAQYMKAIKKAFAAEPMLSHCKLVCEPGRALVAEGGSVVTYSIDGGKSYSTLPLVEERQPDGTVKMVPAPVSMYTEVRYEWADALAAGGKLSASYKVRVK